MKVQDKNIVALLEEVKIEKPSDIIINQIRKLISEGQLNPGDFLPSERLLAEKFNIGRGYVREAIRRLEFYGILKTLPQKGTYVSDLGVRVLDGLIANILQLEKSDFESLVEVRTTLEIQAARLAASRSTSEDLRRLKMALQDLESCINNNAAGIEEDLMFHLRIAEASHNNVLRSLISLIAQDIIGYSRKYNTCRDGRFKQAYFEHKKIYEAIAKHDPFEAENAMKDHLVKTLASK